MDRFGVFCVALLVVCSVFVTVGGKSASQEELKSRNEKLTELTSKGESSVIKLTKKLYNDYIAGKGRDYSAIIMFTATSPSRGCDMCITFYNEFKTVASSWNYFNSGPNKVYFFLADYDSSAEVFQSFNLQGVPVVSHIPASLHGKLSTEKMPLRQEDDLLASGIANWLGKTLKTPVKIKYPFPWVKVIGSVTSVLFVITMVYLTKDKFSLKMASIRNFVGCIILAIVYYFLGGAMWNKIHRSPFSIRDRSGGESYFGRGRSEQVVAETYILMGFYGMMTLGFIIMTEAPLVKGKKYLKIGVMFLGLALFVGFFQAMLSTAVMKQNYLPHTSILWWL